MTREAIRKTKTNDCLKTILNMKIQTEHQTNTTLHVMKQSNWLKDSK